MALLKLNHRIKSLKNVQRLVSTLPSANVSNDEYTETPQYPPILDLSFEKRMERKEQCVHDAIKAVKTVEEKQIKLNMPKYYGFKCYIFREDKVPYNNLQLAQHLTRTHLIENDALPTFYNGVNVDSLSATLQGDIEDALLVELEGYKRLHEVKEQDLSNVEIENIVTNSICKSLNRLLLNNLKSNHPQLKDLQTDINPRLESSWFVGGIHPPLVVRRRRKNKPWLDEMRPTNRAIQYFGTPCLTVRSEHPLEPIIPFSEAINDDFKVPVFKYDPRTVDNVTEHRRLCNIPGHWPGETKLFGIVSYNPRGYMLQRNFNDPQDQKEAIHRQGILASFGWLNAQANYLGFTTFNEITYPLATQIAVTNGKLWSFYVYQLNTLLVNQRHFDTNPKKNVCWATSELKLFENVENGKIVGFNPDVLKNILKFYANTPKERKGVNMTPYLCGEEKVIADYTDDDKRNWLEREYKFLVANRERHKPVPEVFHWEKIYKIDNKTRFMDRKSKPFEFGQNPFKRRLDERQAFYIPKALRPDLPKNKGRWAKEYFP